MRWTRAKLTERSDLRPKVFRAKRKDRRITIRLSETMYESLLRESNTKNVSERIREILDWYLSD